METSTAPPVAHSLGNLSIRQFAASANAGRPAPDSAQYAADAANDDIDDLDGEIAMRSELPAVSYPLYTPAQLQDFIRRSSTALSGAAEVTLAAISEPGLYTLTAALFSYSCARRRNPGAGPPAGTAALPDTGVPDAALPDTGVPDAALPDAALPDAALPDAALIDELRQELRWRNCRAMGCDPAGAVRRGRLLQLIGSFTTLSHAGASPLQRHRRRGDCPLCAGPATLSVFLDRVRWRCFGCDRQGGLPEFAAAMLDTIAPPE